MKSERMPSPLLSSLLSRLVDGLLDDSEAAKLEEILRKNQAARAFYRQYLSTHLDLTEAMPQLGASFAPAPVWFRRPSVLLALVASIVLAFGLAIFPLRPGARVDRPVPAAVSGPVLAVTVLADGVGWDMPQAPIPGQSLRAGPVRISEGTLAMAMNGGQTVTVKGPAQFELIDDREMLLRQGNAALRMAHGSEPYIIRVPKGAVVDLGTEFSVKVGKDGAADVWVFEGKAQASYTSDKWTQEEQTLVAGESVHIDKNISPSTAKITDFLRPFLGLGIPDSPAGESYGTAVRASNPTAWWRFERVDDGKTIPEESGGPPLKLIGAAKISGFKAGQRYLYTDSTTSAGFAMPATGLDGLDTPNGMTIEFLCLSSSEEYASIIAMELFGADYSRLAKRNGVNHAPTRVLIERMCRKGDHIGHVHPDFAIRGMLRSPADYWAGSNIYSSQGHLLHRWVHVALTYSGKSILIYIDGKLSSKVDANLKFLGNRLRPIIGRMQPNQHDELRQWNGGIDEVALYGRVLTPTEIAAHAESLVR